MLRRHTLAPLAAAAAAFFGTQANALDMSGSYLRAGAGESSAGGSQTCFQLPGAYAKYRLGNECNTYGELNFNQNVYDGKDGVKFDFHAMLAINNSYGNQQDYESESVSGQELAMRQTWVEAKNLPGLGGATVWAGKRYYERQDVHINDFFYWDPSGYGVGIQDVPVFGDTKFSYALFQNSSSQAANNNVAIWRHDIRLKGIPLGGFGDLTVGADLNQAKTTSAAAAAGQDTSGWAVNAQHFISVLGGFNKLAVQYGQGTANSLVYGYPNYGATSANKTTRVVEMLQVQISPSFSGMGTIVYQNAKNNYKWISFGVRPVWHITDYFKIQAEYGHDEVTPTNPAPGDGKRKLDKFTIAPTLVAGRGFWARPELRLYYTHASWNDKARDQWGGVAGGTGGVFGNNTQGNQYGFQVESWF